MISPECLHISLGQDLKTMFSRNKFKKNTHHESVIQLCYTQINSIDKLLSILKLKVIKIIYFLMNT